MIDLQAASITALVMLISLVLLGLTFHVRTRIYQTVIRYLPLGRIGSFIAKFNEVALVIISTVMTYNIIWPSYFLVVPTIVKWSYYCFGLSQFRGQPVQAQQGQGYQDAEGNKEDEINLDFEKEKSYVKAALRNYPNLSPEHLLQALRYLQDQGLFHKRDVVDLCHAIDYIKSNGHVQRQVTSVDNEPTFQQHRHSREELLEILVASNKFDRRDIMDVMNRYHEQHGQTPTMEQFVEFHGGLKGLADLEAKLETEKRTLDRTIEVKDRTIEENHRTIEDKDRTIEDNHRTIEDKDRTIEDKDRTIEDNHRTIEENHRRISRLENRLLCKICMDDEMSVACIPCGHLYCCSNPQCRNDMTTRGRCHICNQVVTGQFLNRLA